MKLTTDKTKKAWASGDYTGVNRPMVRVTVQRMDVSFHPYTLRPTDVLSEHVTDRTGKYTSAIFNQPSRPVELPNLKSMRWSRSVDEPIATASFEFYNTAPLPLGANPLPSKQFDQPGYYTHNRGRTPYSTINGHTVNGWQGLLAPDRLLRTWEGYGFDPELPADKDPNMNPSGVWLIDSVAYTHDGMIAVEARDLGRILADQICYPPVVPFAEYPLYWDAFHHVANPDIVETTTTGSDAWVRPRYDYDSNIAWVGGGTMHGHHGRHAFDGNANTYFLSVGNSTPREPFAYEYVQGAIDTGAVGAVSAHAYAGPYTVYISVYANGRWQGSNTIPYNQAGIGRNKTDIPFVLQSTIGANENKTFRLPSVIPGATKVRVTFGNLWNSGIGTYKYRGAVREVMAYVTTKQTVTTVKDGGTHIEGNYGDYTDIVKYFLAWSGWFWPNGTSKPVPGGGFISIRPEYVLSTDGTKTYFTYRQTDPAIGGKGRIWGDFQQTGTQNKLINLNGTNHTDGQFSAKLDIDVWDKQPIIDCIKYVQEIVGFNFFIDEHGGAVFRSPNIWRVGNYVSYPNKYTTGYYSGTFGLTTLRDTEQMITLTAGLSSRNVRERVFVGNIPGNMAALSSGYNPYPSGLRRVGGWTDQRFASVEECQRMADLITMRQSFTYREDQITIAANPAIQIDDQVIVKEATTGEDYYHYVKSIDSSWDVEDGKWTYDLTTHWLGERPFTRWAFNPYDPNQLNPTTLQYLRQSLGVLP